MELIIGIIVIYASVLILLFIFQRSLMYHPQENNYFGDQTLILVTHRMSLLKMVDRVIAVDEGKVTVDGKKEDILKRLQGFS